MSALKDRLRADLTASMKARDEVRSSTLRMVLTAITNAEVAGKAQRELSDDDVVACSHGGEEAPRGGDRVRRTPAARRWPPRSGPSPPSSPTTCPSSSPPTRSPTIVRAAVEETGAAGEGTKAMGRVMGVVQPRVKGRADGGAVAAEVRRQLG